VEKVLRKGRCVQSTDNGQYFRPHSLDQRKYLFGYADILAVGTATNNVRLETRQKLPDPLWILHPHVKYLDIMATFHPSTKIFQCKGFEHEKKVSSYHMGIEWCPD